ncbi:hypothetical protein SAMN05216238_11284 [Lentibacillus persicus]|uniref:Uncharacterized protein n=1 Tax=Lentibacillus persicus TaxID=640948 RepID=A0A1I1ZG47_9BACI|nr:hypothetical protein [Lentibacillus persicus]SFE30667.1 hypothetical protein SAMN05216238_11284 [Lentibacillus persicus]
MKTKRLRNWLIGLMVLVVLTLSIAFSYSGFAEAKNTCVENNGTIAKQNLDLLAFNWSISCDK